jgi:hypothetical protein
VCVASYMYYEYDQRVEVMKELKLS